MNLASSAAFIAFAAILVPGAARAQLPTRLVIDSPDDSSAFAVAAAAAGDQNGDGINDVAIAETTTAPFTPDDQVHVFSGAD